VTAPVSFFAVPPNRDPTAILQELSSFFPIRLVQTSRERVTYLDTFDWRLMDAGYSLAAAPGGTKMRLTLASDSGEVLETRVGILPAFAEDLEDGPLKKTLSRLTKVRRLFPQARATWSQKLWAVLDENEKTVVRIRQREGTATTPEGRRPVPVPPRLQVLPLKGYRQEFRRAVAGLREVGVSRALPRNQLATILEALGKKPERHSSSTILPLEPGLRGDEAAKLIHRELLLTMEVNLPGVLQDLDSEFLHEFRVAGRRTRSALTQIKEVFPPGVVARYKEEFRWLGRRTGPTRDLDVYLLKIPSYRKALPDGVGDELDPLVEFLRRKKKQHHRGLVRSLETKRYRALVASWSTFLESSEPEAPLPRNAARPVAAVARERILAVYRKILNRGAKIKKDTPADALHRLRIDCKKLRYLMTFFQTLFPREALTPLIKELKNLQDNLGDFNDLQVQSRALQSFAQEMMDLGVGPPATLMAMGQLMGSLEAQQATERLAFHRRFRTFARRENRRHFEELFG
jgi:CHAD domain-containing protein